MKSWKTWQVVTVVVLVVVVAALTFLYRGPSGPWSAFLPIGGSLGPWSAAELPGDLNVTFCGDVKPTVDAECVGLPCPSGYKCGSIYLSGVLNCACGVIILSCGNNIVEAWEECDDGDTESCNGCSGICSIEECGNGTIDCTDPGDPGPPFVPPKEEECDDENTTNEDGCSASCKMEYCSDGVVQAGLGEACDDGNATSCDGCSLGCKDERCGDGIVCPPEQCDDGNTVGMDGCSASCKKETHRCTYKCLGTESRWMLLSCLSTWSPAGSTPACPPSLECGLPPRTATHKISGDTTTCFQTP